MVVCDLGNPMKGGTKVSAHLTGQATPPLSSSFQMCLMCFGPSPCSLIGLGLPCCAVVGQVLAELRFSVHQLSEEDTTVKFDLQMVR